MGTIEHSVFLFCIELNEHGRAPNEKTFCFLKKKKNHYSAFITRRPWKCVRQGKNKPYNCEFNNNVNVNVQFVARSSDGEEKSTSATQMDGGSQMQTVQIIDSVGDDSHADATNADLQLQTGNPQKSDFAVDESRTGTTNGNLQLQTGNTQKNGAGNKKKVRDPKPQKRSAATREYEVAEIIKHRLLKSGVTEYRIRWSGFSPNANTWEPETNLNCGELLADYYLKKAVVEEHEETDDGADDDDKNDGNGDYNPPVELPIPNQRKSKRAKKAVQCLVYSHTARCAFCNMQLPICEEKVDLSFCTAKCMDNFLNDGQEISRTSQTESDTVSHEKLNRTEALAAESRRAENSVDGEEILRMPQNESDTISHEKLNRRIPNLISVDNYLPRMFGALPNAQSQPIRGSAFHVFQPFHMSSANENGSTSQDSSSRLLQRIPANYPLQAPHKIGYNQLVSSSQFAANYHVHHQAPRGIGYNQPLSSSQFTTYERSAFAANYPPQTAQPGAGFNPQDTQAADGTAAIQDSGNQSPTNSISNQENKVPNMMTDPYGFIKYFRKH